jgi:uncharacterized protein YggT (Ycf19 family)
MDLGSYYILHVAIDIAFKLMIIALLVRVILSWLPFPPGNPIVLFFTRLTDPIIQPIARRIPSGSFGPLNLSFTIAIIFAWWILSTLDALLMYALPPGW